MPHQLPFGAQTFKEHHELQLEKDDRINGGTPSAGIGLVHQLAHKRQIKRALQVTIKVILRYQLF